MCVCGGGGGGGGGGGLLLSREDIVEESISHLNNGDHPCLTKPHGSVHASTVCKSV